MKRNPFKTIIVTGVPGVGKTTVLNMASRILSRKNIKYLIANFGDYMLKEAIDEGIVSSRDELRKLPHRKQLELQRNAARRIIGEASKAIDENGVLLIDTHSIIKTTAGYWPGLPEHVVKELNPDSIVLIEAEPSEIIERQTKDKGRDRRDVGELEVIKELLLMARVAAVSSATLTASSVYIITNPKGKAEEAASKLVELISKI